DGIRDKLVTGVQTCALPISAARRCFLLEGRRRIPAAVRAWRAGDCREPHGCGTARWLRHLAEHWAEWLPGRKRHHSRPGGSRARSEERRVGKECRPGRAAEA